MPLLPNFKRIVKTDYPQDIQPVIEKLSYVVNDGIGTVYNALAGRLDSTNLLVSIKDVTLQVDAGGIPLSRSTFSIEDSKINTVIGCPVLRVVNETNAAVFPSSGVTVTFTQEAKTIVVNHVTGLLPGYVWTIRIEARG